MKNENLKEKNLKGRLLKRSLLTASTVLVIGATTVGAQSNDYISMFFGKEETSKVEKHNSDQVSKVISGIEMEVEESIIGGKTALIIVSFEKEDGTAFSGDIIIPTLELDLKQNASYMVEQQMTEDHKKLITMFDIDTTKNIDGEKITIMADSIVDRHTDNVIADGPFHLSFEADESKTSKNIKTSINLSAEHENLALRQFNISANGIGVEGTRLNGEKDVLPKYSPSLTVTTLDNNTFELKPSSTSSTKSGFKWQYNINENEERILLNNENIKTLIIDGHTIDVTDGK
ncbi:hypothetical protein [Lysinibacillus sp. SGAir0095]|uniref:hypothetical protein n=1 Tax=Lysinibacillus sp. SGAir0095 TaxID=2070463 RepID=UPI0010CCF1E2|nr:hypothetical protein [Lysinibacillus sp. SGAir0095]QCR32467.1 hypothetical protein C1N55_09895 [Lysinibacillus sp. SGAir0095]